MIRRIGQLDMELKRTFRSLTQINEVQSAQIKRKWKLEVLWELVVWHNRLSHLCHHLHLGALVQVLGALLLIHFPANAPQKATEGLLSVPIRL